MKYNTQLSKHPPRTPCGRMFLLRGSYEYNPVKPVPKVGIEPTFPKEHDFESCASAYSATSANMRPKVYHSQHVAQETRSVLCYRLGNYETRNHWTASIRKDHHL